MKKVFRFFKQYSLFSLALVGASVALGLDLGGLDKWAHGTIIGIAVIALGPLLWGMVRDLQKGTYGIDLLAAAAIITSLLLGEYWAAIVIILMLTGGESLEDYAEHRARKELDALLSRAPQKANVLRGKKEVEIPASEVQVGDRIVLRPGDIVPVDAIIIEGTASFDESSLTGESLPQVKGIDESIMSGSINTDGALVVKALHAAEDSQYAQIIKLVRAAQNSQAPFVRLADKYAIPFTIISFGIAGSVWAFTGDARRFLEVLVVATPCPLILAAPIAIISGMSRASRQGIIVKTGSALERLATARTFAFDKTGTLTQGQLQVASIQTFGTYKKADVLAWAAALEQSSKHVLARAIIAQAQADKLSIKKANHVHESAGHGLSATLSGKSIMVGRLSMLLDNDIALPAAFDAKTVNTTAAFVAVNKELAGVITFTDNLRPETKDTVDRLHKLGMDHIVMITGDNKATAKAIAKSAGIKDYYAEALPGDKIRILEQIDQRPVAFVGDGVNDAPVLTASDVGIALGARGSAAASESADVVIMQDNLGHVADSRAIARQTFSIAKQSIFIGIGLSIGLMAVFATGKFKPIHGAVIQEVVDIIVIINALRAHGTFKKKSSV